MAAVLEPALISKARAGGNWAGPETLCWLTTCLKDLNKMERRLGKIQARHRQVNDLYDVELKETAAGVRLLWQIKEDRKNWRESWEGAYLLRTNLKAETVKQLWAEYMQLTEAEASFRALKSELSIRPLFHQLDPRVKAHVMVAFFGVMRFGSRSNIY